MKDERDLSEAFTLGTENRALLILAVDGFRLAFATQDCVRILPQVLRRLALKVSDS